METPNTHDPETPLDRHALADIDAQRRCPLCGGTHLSRSGLRQFGVTVHWYQDEEVHYEQSPEDYGDAPYCTVRWECLEPGCTWAQTYDVGEGA